MLLNELNISDGKIISFGSSLSGLKICLQDWQEQKWLISFSEVLSVQAMSAECEELSHLGIIEDDDFKINTMEFFSDERPDNYFCYHFYGVWTEKALLKIVATNNYNITKLS